MRRIDFPDLEIQLLAYMQRYAAHAPVTATFSDLTRQKNAVPIVVGDLIGFLKERGYRVVGPDIVQLPGIPHGSYPGRFGVDEPEPGEAQK